MKHTNFGSLFSVATLALAATLFGCTNPTADDVDTNAAAISNGTADFTHTGVGAFLIERSGQFYPVCSGALLSPTVFITAGHCVAAATGSSVAVTFSQSAPYPLVAGTPVVRGTAVQNPAYVATDAHSDTNDIALVILDTAVTDKPVAKLPTLGIVDTALVTNKTNLILSGYGLAASKEGLIDPAGRMTGTALMKSTRSYLIDHQAAINSKKGYSTTCYGDSGGAMFANIGGKEVLVGVTIWGKSGQCTVGGWAYRLDSPQARGFLGQYVTLP